MLYVVLVTGASKLSPFGSFQVAVAPISVRSPMYLCLSDMVLVVGEMDG